MVKTSSRPDRSERAAPAGPGPAIRTDGLTKRYGTRTVVDGLSITVPAGSVTGFVGPNGAGKSTTIRMLTGLIRPTAGDAAVLGGPVSRPGGYLGRVGALIEAPAFYPKLSARANLEVFGRLHGHDLARVGPVLEQVGLTDRAGDRAGAFSLGMKQRLAIAIALLGQPELLILDEPVNGLDPAGVHEIRELLRRLGQAGTTVFVSSHLLAEVEQACDWLVVLRQGRCLFQGRTEDLLATGVAGVQVAVEDRTRLPLLERVCVQAGYPLRADGEALLVECPPDWAGELNRRAMAAGVVLTELVAKRSQLEGVFLEITGDEETEGSAPR